MILDKKGKLFGKVSVVDIFIVIIVISLIAGAYYKLKAPVSTAIYRGDKVINFSVKIQDVRSFTTSYYQKGMSVYDSKTGNYLGKIENVNVEPFMDRIEKSDGTIVRAEKTGKVEIVLDITGQGIETEQAYMVEGTYEVKIGSGVYLGTKYVDVTGFVCAVSAE